MRRRLWTAVALAAVFAVPGCRRDAGRTPEVAASPGPGSGTAGSALPFEPPADGRLTAAQVEMYISVRRRAQGGRTQASPGVAAAPGQLADLAAAERRVASDLGRDVDEYLWVSARIAEASPAAPEGLGGLADAIEAAARTGRERVMKEAAEPGQPATPSGPGPDEAARAYNRQMLERYRSELDALRQPPALPAPPGGPPGS